MTGTNTPNNKQPFSANTHIRVHAARVHYAVSDTPHISVTKHLITYRPHLLVTMTHPKMCRWLIAVGKRPVPFRTRKLSPPALMVLHPGGCGRVSYRRPKNTNKQLHNTNAAPTTPHSGGSRVNSCFRASPEQGFGKGQVGVAARRKAAWKLAYGIAESECDGGEHHGFAEVFAGGW